MGRRAAGIKHFGMTTCPFCKDSVSSLEAVLCPACEAAHHEECWEANGETCSVYGCKSNLKQERLLGCPWCDEVYTVGRRFCMICNQPLMNSRDYRSFLEGHDWIPLKLPDHQNILLTAGYLRNHGVVARINKGNRSFVTNMLGIPSVESLMVAAEDRETAISLMQDLSVRFTNCETCGHVLAQEENCSYCSEEAL
jgi:hypothetical protein